MDVNSVIQNTRQFFRGLPSSSPASGELAPGASVGYCSPPVSSTATTLSTNLFPPYQQTFSQQTSWSTSDASAVIRNAAGAYHLPSSSTSLVVNNPPYPSTYPSAMMPSQYRSYENPRPKMSTSTSSVPPQHIYTIPSITRINNNFNQGMYNMDSIVCQPNVNPNKKLKTKLPALTNSSSALSNASSASAGTYEQPVHKEESRNTYHNRLTPLSQSPTMSTHTAASGGTSGLPSVVVASPLPPHSASPTSHIGQLHGESASTNLLNYSCCIQMTDHHHHHHQKQPQQINYEQRRQQKQQHQTGFHNASSTLTEKVSQHKPTDLQYYNYRRITETSSEMAPSLQKRDSPLDLSVKTIRQSADSTAHDDSESVYGHHFPVVSHHPLKIERQHSHIPQLPYSSSLALSNVLNYSTASHEKMQNRQTHLAANTGTPKVCSETRYNSFNNDPLSEDRVIAVSITYEEEARMHRTQVNAQISATQYSDYRHLGENNANGLSRLPQSSQPSATRALPRNHSPLPDKKNHLPLAQAALPMNTAAISRKRRPFGGESSTFSAKSPRTSTDWRECIDKEIENRLNEYTKMKAREEEERKMALKKNNDNSYHNDTSQVNHRSPIPVYNESCKHLSDLYCPDIQQNSPVLPFTQYAETKAQRKSPMPPAHAYPSQLWYLPPHQTSQQSYPLSNSQLNSHHSLSPNKPFEMKNNHRVEQLSQEPLPPFQALPLKKLQEMRMVVENAEKSVENLPLLSKKMPTETQSREALMASALTHPRIRTKAELKQVSVVAPVDKSKHVAPTSENNKVIEKNQSVVTGTLNVENSELVENKLMVNLESRIIFDSENSVTMAASSLTNTAQIDNKPCCPRKKLFIKTKNNGFNKNDIKSTIFEFRDSDSEPGTPNNDLHSLNQLRKDKKSKTISGMSAIIDQEIIEDSTFLEACDELIQQFSNNNHKKRGRKKKAGDDETQKPKKKQTEEERSDTSDIEIAPPKEKSPIRTNKIKEERLLNEEIHVNEKLIKRETSVKIDAQEIVSVESIMESSANRECDRERLVEKYNLSAIRRQRSNVNTTRIRIQNLLQDDSDSEQADDDKGDDYDFEDECLIKKTTTRTKSVKKFVRPVSKKKLPTKKPKLMKKLKKSKKTIKSKVLKKAVVDREKVRHMILRRMETRRSKIEAMKNLQKVKTESLFSEDHPIMTRKMTLKESKKKNCVVSTTVMAKISRKGKKTHIHEKLRNKKEHEKLEQNKQTSDSDRPETRNYVKGERARRLQKTKYLDSKNKERNDNDTRRTLRSRNAVVPAIRQIEKKRGNYSNVKCKSNLSPKEKKETKNDEKAAKEKSSNIVEQKGKTKDADKKKDMSKNKEKEEEAETNQVTCSWEEELFNYKCSLRMPVKLINISGPNNWPNSGSGGASSLPDLDRNETDSDILQGISKQKSSKKKNKGESKYLHSKEFKDSVKNLQNKFDKKVEEKYQTNSLTKLMLEKKMKTIPKSSDGPELLPTPSLDSFKWKLNSLTPKKDCKIGKDAGKDDLIENSLVGYVGKETVTNQFETVILETRTRTQAKELKRHETLKQVFGCNRPASAPPVPDIDDLSQSSPNTTGVGAIPILPSEKNVADAMSKHWQKSFTKVKCLVSDRCVESDKDSKEFEENVDFIIGQEDDIKDCSEIGPDLIVKKKGRSIRRKYRSSGFDYIRKKKKQKKEDDDESIEDKEKKKLPVTIRPTSESIEDIQNEIKSWVVNKGIGETVLHKAARLGYLDISSYCLEKLNCVPSPTDNAGYTPLHEACTRGHMKIAKMLLKYGADVSASARGGIRPLHEAVESGDIELVRLLLSYGADPLLSTYGGQTPLSLIKKNQDSLREFLLLYLADIQGNPSKPWHFSIIDDVDPELNGYSPLNGAPPLNLEDADTLVIEMSDNPLPSLYRFQNEFDYWVLSLDLPVRIREMVNKCSQDQSQSQFVLRKISRIQFEEDVDCVMLLESKHLYKSKSKLPLITMVKYNDKLLGALNIQKLNLTFS